MQFPWFSTGLIVCLTIVYNCFRRTARRKKVALLQCQPFPEDTERPETGYYWLTGPLQCTQPFTYDWAIRQYQIFQKQGWSLNWNLNCRNVVKFYDSPVQYSSNLNIDGANIDEFRTLIPLSLQQEFFSVEPDLNNASILTNTDNNDTIDSMYTHHWYAVKHNQILTIIGKWDYLMNRFVLSNSINIISEYDYVDIVNNHEYWMQLIKFIYQVSVTFSFALGFAETIN